MELALANYLIDQLKGLGFDYVSPASFLATDPSGGQAFHRAVGRYISCGSGPLRAFL